jgi:hypothetical protein
MHRCPPANRALLHSTPRVMHMVIHRGRAVASPWEQQIGGVVDIRSGQMLAWDNKIAGGFNTTDVPLEFCLLQSEVAEAFDSWRKGRVDVGEGLADVAIFLFGLAQMTGVDLDEEIEARIAKNCRNGVLAKSD